MMELYEVRRRRSEGQTLQMIANAAGTSRQGVHDRLKKTAAWTLTDELHERCGSRMYQTIGRNGYTYRCCGGCVHAQVIDRTRRAA